MAFADNADHRVMASWEIVVSFSILGAIAGILTFFSSVAKLDLPLPERKILSHTLTCMLAVLNSLYWLADFFGRLSMGDQLSLTLALRGLLLPAWILLAGLASWHYRQARKSYRDAHRPEEAPLPDQPGNR